jgi:hypothetical protein
VQDAGFEVEVRGQFAPAGDRLGSARACLLEVAGLVLGHALEMPDCCEIGRAAQDFVVERDRSLEVAPPVQRARLLDAALGLRVAHEPPAATTRASSFAPLPGSQRWASSATP